MNVLKLWAYVLNSICIDCYITKVFLSLKLVTRTAKIFFILIWLKCSKTQ